MQKFAFVFFIFISISALSQQTSKIDILVSVDEIIKKDWSENGRLIIFFSKNGDRDPLFQETFSSGRSGFARNIKQWKANKICDITSDNSFVVSDFELNKVPAGKWFVQAVYNVSEIPDFSAAGNLYSETNELYIEKDQTIELVLSKTIEKRPNSEPTDTEQVKYVEFESKLLSDFWGKPMKIKASVLLPRNFKKEKTKKYPVRINIGGYGSSWTRASRLEHDSTFIAWWNSEEAPEFINIFPDGDGPFGDPYYIDSENNGPYGSSLTQELIPFIEKEFNGMSDSKYRFVDGCSTGGWVSFALQVFYPDFFNGAWSFSADPVDFHHMQLVNMYEDKNAYYNQHGYLTPSMRSKTGQPSLSIKAEVAGENINSFDNTFTTSGGQWGGWNALYSPKGKDGLPMAAFHPVTGEIDSLAVENWEKYDLVKTLADNWEEIGPKLQGKLWVWMGDMDQFYLNNAMREMDKFLKSTANPKSDAKINFEATKGHCEEYSHRWVLEMMQEKINRLKSE